MCPPCEGTGWAGAFDVPVGEFTAEQRDLLLWAEPQRMNYLGPNSTYEGLIPKLTKSVLSKERSGLQKAMREFVDLSLIHI